MYAAMMDDEGASNCEESRRLGTNTPHPYGMCVGTGRQMTIEGV